MLSLPWDGSSRAVIGNSKKGKEAKASEICRHIFLFLCLVWESFLQPSTITHELRFAASYYIPCLIFAILCLTLHPRGFGLGLGFIFFNLELLPDVALHVSFQSPQNQLNTLQGYKCRIVSSALCLSAFVFETQDNGAIGGRKFFLFRNKAQLHFENLKPFRMTSGVNTRLQVVLQLQNSCFLLLDHLGE